MRFWVREVAGWLLVLLGLYLFLVCLGLLLDPGPRGPAIVQAGPVTLIGIIIFRGGIHLLKVAVAARVCMASRPTAKPRERTSAAKPTGWDAE